MVDRMRWRTCLEMRGRHGGGHMALFAWVKGGT